MRHATGTYIAALSREWIWPPSIRYSARVKGAGTTAVNGVYDFNGTLWSMGSYSMSKAPDWSLRRGATVLYTAPATQYPWEAGWILATGLTPPPAVLDYANS